MHFRSAFLHRCEVSGYCVMACTTHMDARPRLGARGQVSSQHNQATDKANAAVIRKLASSLVALAWQQHALDRRRTGQVRHDCSDLLAKLAPRGEARQHCVGIQTTCKHSAAHHIRSLGVYERNLA